MGAPILPGQSLAHQTIERYRRTCQQLGVIEEAIQRLERSRLVQTIKQLLDSGALRAVAVMTVERAGHGAPL